MRRLLWIVAAWCFTVGSVSAQTSVSDAEAEQMVDRVNAAAGAMKSLRCRFVQTKSLKVLDGKVVSEGRMCYTQPDRLRWEYTSPYAYLFVIHGSEVTVSSRGRKDVIDAGANKVVRQITKLMLSTVTGKCLSDERAFRVRMQRDGKRWKALLEPQKKELKQVFSRIDMTFDSERMVPVEIVMVEQGGDYTRIELKEVETDVEIAEEEYVVD